MKKDILKRYPPEKLVAKAKAFLEYTQNRRPIRIMLLKIIEPVCGDGALTSDVVDAIFRAELKGLIRIEAGKRKKKRP